MTVRLDYKVIQIEIDMTDTRDYKVIQIEIDMTVRLDYKVIQIEIDMTDTRDCYHQFFEIDRFFTTLTLYTCVYRHTQKTKCCDSLKEAVTGWRQWHSISSAYRPKEIYARFRTGISYKVSYIAKSQRICPRKLIRRT
ncbi:hypothetical protein VCRA2110O183_330057 [Vibrio crassostreae]|nr:hypothetical protein VCRA2110O183_330057 [Vibrio crassostreae]